MSYRISVDTGGTFTDIVVVDDEGNLNLGKALTTYDRAFVCVAEALAGVAETLGTDTRTLLAQASEFTYGTTRSTNAIVEAKTSRTAFFTTEGFPDILLLREGGKLDPFRQIAYPPPYVPRFLTFEIAERMDSDGTPFRTLEEESVITAIAAARRHGAEAIGVSLIWSTVNPAHELRVGELIEERAPGLAYTLSHQLNPIVREYRRASSTVIDASLKPIMQGFLRELESDLSAAGFDGQFFVTTSFGGAWRPDEVVDRPIYSVGSGPSMAPVAALTYGQLELGDEDGAPDLLVCDTGGTTFDVGLVSEGAVQYTSETWLGGRWIGHITGTRAVDVRSIGSGGGSIAGIDSGGLLHVGPRSAGADPGPACYGRGGSEPTITDAAVLLGYLDPSNFLGGRLVLDVEAARKAFVEIAERLGMSIEKAAQATLTVAAENIVGAIREITISQGIDPREVTMVAGGGASGINIVPIARELGCGRVLLPRTAGALSACGGVYSDMVTEFTASYFAETNRLDHEALNAVLAELAAKGQRFLDSLGGIDVTETRLEFLVDARYRGQVWELTVPLPVSCFETEADVEGLVERFHDEHERVFAVREPGQYLECLTWKVRAVADLTKPDAAAGMWSGDSSEPTEVAPAHFGDGLTDVPRYDGQALATGTEIEGPAVIREPTTTVVVYPGSRAMVTAAGNYLIHIDLPGEQRARSGAAMEVQG